MASVDRSVKNCYIVEMIEKALITSCSNKFFPAVINLIGSIENNYPNHPPIYVYDQGLFPLFKKELAKRKNVTVVPIPAFCPHFRACYTWKPYIFAHAPARLNLYMDAGYEVLKPLDAVFKSIEKNDYFVVGQGLPLENTVPLEYKTLFPIEERFYKETYITAGFWGFKIGSKVDGVIKTLYDAAIAGLCLGFSPVEFWRNKGKNKNQFVRNCNLFRFDTSIFSLIMRKELKDFIVEPREKYDSGKILNDVLQITYNARLTNVKNENIVTKTFFARNFIYLFILLKKIK